MRMRLLTGAVMTMMTSATYAWTIPETLSFCLVATWYDDSDTPFWLQYSNTAHLESA